MCRFADPAADMHDSVFRLFVSSCSTDLRVRLLRLLSRKELEEDEAAERSNLRTHFGESLPDVPHVPQFCLAFILSTAALHEDMFFGPVLALGRERTDRILFERSETPDTQFCTCYFSFAPDRCGIGLHLGPCDGMASMDFGASYVEYQSSCVPSQARAC